MSSAQNSVRRRSVGILNPSALLWGVLCGLWFVGTGCVRVSPLVSELAGLESVSSRESAEVLGALHRAAEEIRSLRVLLRGRAQRGVAKESFRQVVVFDRPSRLRLEFLDAAISRLAVIAVMNGGMLQVIDQNEERGYIGDPSLENCTRLTGIPLEPEELMLWVSGRFDPNRYETAEKDVFRRRDGSERILKVVGDDGRTFVITLDEGRVSAFQLFDRKGERLLTTSYRYDLASQSGQTPVLPSEISFSTPTRKVEGRLRLDHPEVNLPRADLRDRLFALTIPERYAVYALDDAQGIEFHSPVE